MGHGRKASTNKLPPEKVPPWSTRLHSVWWAGRTSLKSIDHGLGFTPFIILYGEDAIIPIEFLVPSQRLAVKFRLGDKESMARRLQKLVTMMEEDRNHAEWSTQARQQQRKADTDRRRREIKPKAVGTTDWSDQHAGAFDEKSQNGSGCLIESQGSGLGLRVEPITTLSGISKTESPCSISNLGSGKWTVIRSRTLAFGKAYFYKTTDFPKVCFFRMLIGRLFDQTNSWILASIKKVPTEHFTVTTQANSDEWENTSIRPKKHSAILRKTSPFRLLGCSRACRRRVLGIRLCTTYTHQGKALGSSGLHDASSLSSGTWLMEKCVRIGSE